MKRTFLLTLCIAMTGCAELHQIQISDIDQRGGEQTKFDIKGSSTGLDLGEAGDIARIVSRKDSALNVVGSTLSAAWHLITYGPRTGNVTFSSSYGDALAGSLQSVCPGGRIGMLTSIRESNHYPVVSGEIVRFVGYCTNHSSIKGS